MSNLSPRDVERALYDADQYFSWSELAWQDFDPETLTVNGDEYPYEFVEGRTGSEGDYETSVFVVFRVGDQVFRKTGWYASHVGSEWDGSFTEVRPVERTITVWEDV